MKGSLELRPPLLKTARILLSLALLTLAWAAKTPNQQVLLSQSQHAELAAERAAEAAAQEEVEQAVEELAAQNEVEQDLARDTNQEKTATSKQPQQKVAQPTEQDFNEMGIQSSLMPVAVPVASAAEAPSTAVQQSTPVDQKRTTQAAKSMTKRLEEKGSKHAAYHSSGAKPVVAAAETQNAKATTHAVKQPAEKDIGVARVMPAAETKNAKATTHVVKQPPKKTPGVTRVVPVAEKTNAKSAAHVVRQPAGVKRVVPVAETKNAKAATHNVKQVPERIPDAHAPRTKAAVADVTTVGTASQTKAAQRAHAQSESKRNIFSDITNSAIAFFGHAIDDISGFASKLSNAGSAKEMGLASAAFAPVDDAKAAEAQQSVGEQLVIETQGKKTDKTAGTVATLKEPSKKAVQVSNPATTKLQLGTSTHSEARSGPDNAHTHAAHAAKDSAATVATQQSVSQKLDALAKSTKHDKGAGVPVTPKSTAKDAVNVPKAANKDKGIKDAKVADASPGINDLTNFAAKLSRERKKLKVAEDETHLDVTMHSKTAVANAGPKHIFGDHLVRSNQGVVSDAEPETRPQHQNAIAPETKDKKATAKTEKNRWKKHPVSRMPHYVGSSAMTSDWGQEYSSSRLSVRERDQYLMRIAAKKHRGKLKAEADDDDDNDDDPTHSGTRRNTFAGVLGLGLASLGACL